MAQVCERSWQVCVHVGVCVCVGVRGGHRAKKNKAQRRQAGHHSGCAWRLRERAWGPPGKEVAGTTPRRRLRAGRLGNTVGVGGGISKGMGRVDPKGRQRTYEADFWCTVRQFVIDVCVYMYVCMYVCVCVHVCMYVCMYVRVCVCM